MSAEQPCTPTLLLNLGNVFLRLRTDHLLHLLMLQCKYGRSNLDRARDSLTVQAISLLDGMGL